jgi:hypothetical protein
MKRMEFRRFTHGPQLRLVSEREAAVGLCPIFTSTTTNSNTPRRVFA